jgi:hypothetical protein
VFDLTPAFAVSSKFLTPSVLRPLVVSAVTLATALGLLAYTGDARAQTTLTAPGITSIETWGGTRPERYAIEKRHTPTKLTLHHGGIDFPADKDVILYLRNLQTWSRDFKKWMDIPYHYLIDLQGNVYEGRDIRFAGDTNTEYDPSGHALVVVMGNYDEQQPNEKQIKAIVDTFAWLSVRHSISVDTLAGHKDHAKQTACPGKHLAVLLDNGSLKSQIKKRLNQ